MECCLIALIFCFGTRHFMGVQLFRYSGDAYSCKREISRGGRIWFLYSNGTLEECSESEHGEEEEITDARRLFNIKEKNRPLLGRNQFQGRGSTFSVVEIPFNSPVRYRGFSRQERSQGTDSEESDFISVSENKDEDDSGNWELSSCDDDDDDDYCKPQQYDSDDLY